MAMAVPTPKWLGATLLLALAFTSAQCSIRSGGGTNTGQDGGDFPCDTGADCPEAESPCLMTVCVDGQCALIEGPEGPAPWGLQKAGDCQLLYCTEAGELVTDDHPDDVPASDGNPCTEAACAADQAVHAPVPAQTACGTNRICTGTGHCGVCLPSERQCAGNTVQTCSNEGAWKDADSCDQNATVCSAGRCARVEQLASGSSHACVRLDDGTVRCWGANAHGQLGRGGLTAATLVNWGASPKEVAMGNRHACARRRDGTVWCWGHNEVGQLGRRDTISSNQAALVQPLKAVAKVAVGDGHSCAHDGKRVWCWGDNSRGQLGLGGSKPKTSHASHATHRHTRGQPQPSAIPGVSKATDLSAGRNYTCIDQGGSARCWGQLTFTLPAPASEPEDESGRQRQELPPKTPMPYATTPQRVANVSEPQDLACGDHHCCAIVRDGTVRCWGANDKQQLGHASTSDQTKATVVAGLKRAVRLALGASFSCALLSDKKVHCWGDNHLGQLGRKSPTSNPSPMQVTPLPPAKDLTAGAHFACILTANHAVECWGDRAAGKRGHEKTAHSTAPSPIRWTRHSPNVNKAN